MPIFTIRIAWGFLAVKGVRPLFPSPFQDAWFSTSVFHCNQFSFRYLKQLGFPMKHILLTFHYMGLCSKPSPTPTRKFCGDAKGSALKINSTTDFFNYLWDLSAVCMPDNLFHHIFNILWLRLISVFLHWYIIPYLFPLLVDKTLSVGRRG